MPRTYYRDLIDLLKQGGCEFLRAGKGDHEIWHSPLTDKNLPSIEAALAGIRPTPS